MHEMLPIGCIADLLHLLFGSSQKVSRDSKPNPGDDRAKTRRRWAIGSYAMLVALPPRQRRQGGRAVIES